MPLPSMHIQYGPAHNSCIGPQPKRWPIAHEANVSLKANKSAAHGQAQDSQGKHKYPSKCICVWAFRGNFGAQFQRRLVDSEQQRPHAASGGSSGTHTLE